jgi:(p)ppGpp synthase/HD superfamily hydrolase
MTVYQAALIAEAAHRGQVRKGPRADPYIVHPLRVADLALRAGYSTDVQIAALLHDVVEDTAVTIEDLKALSVPPRALELVVLLTKWWGDTARVTEKAVGKAAYYAAIVRDEEAIGLKLLDRADNLAEMARDLPQCNERERKWSRSYLAKTHAEFAPLLSVFAYARDAARYRDVVLGAYNSALDGLAQNI